MASCFIEDMETAPAFTEIRRGLYMGSKRALSPEFPLFSVYVSMAREIRPPKSVLDRFESMWVKMDDVDWDFRNDPETIQALLDVSETLAQLVKQGHKVLIVCNMGMNRSGLMTAMVLMQLGWPLNKALKKIKQRHRCTLGNSSFIEFLRYLESTRSA